MGANFVDFAFLKKLYNESKKLYGSHLYFGQFAKFAPRKNNHLNSIKHIAQVNLVITHTVTTGEIIDSQYKNFLLQHSTIPL